MTLERKFYKEKASSHERRFGGTARPSHRPCTAAKAVRECRTKPCPKNKKKVARQISPRQKIKHVWFSGAVGSTLWRRGLTYQNGVRWHADRTRSRQVVYIFFQVTCGTSKWRALPRLVRRYFQYKKCILNAVRLCAVTCAVGRADRKYIHYKLLSTRKEKYEI